MLKLKQSKRFLVERKVLECDERFANAQISTKKV